MVAYIISVAIATLLSLQVVFLHNWQFETVRPAFWILTPFLVALTALFFVRGAVKAARFDSARKVA